ncbi:transcription cofactor vestigial-like protein 2 [Physella acuta]|uniref:transcription cofactor vestigial-like protein 2 n=1 Tax=Physella acuta TaxID=109671 RepID=UPI0027DD2A6A|nr:transcription cofactor vestigial-like protein 2 [Physella acuta]
MTCVDVMFQPFPSAFPAYPRAACSADFTHGQSLSRMQEPLDLGSTTSSLSLSTLSYPASSLLTPASSGPPSGPLLSSSNPSSPSSPTPTHVKETKDGEPRGAQYLANNCLLLTYVSGDASTLVDDHFTRALNQTSGYDSSDGHSGTRTKSAPHKAPTPMSARNLPPSFWNSSYQPQPHPHHFLSQTSHHHGNQHPGTSGDVNPFHPAHPYLSPALHGLSNLQPDPWGYSFPSSGPAMPYPHRPVPYDLSYPTSSRFSQNYSSFLVQPSPMRSAQFSGVGSHCDVTKAADHSRSRYGDHRLSSDYASHHGTFSAIDAAGLQEATKDLYWF